MERGAFQIPLFVSFGLLFFLLLTHPLIKMMKYLRLRNQRGVKNLHIL